MHVNHGFKNRVVTKNSYIFENCVFIRISFYLNNLLANLNLNKFENTLNSHPRRESQMVALSDHLNWLNSEWRKLTLES